MNGQVRKELDTHRGVSHIEYRKGFAQVHVTLNRETLAADRLEVLQAIADTDLTLNFVKLTPAGISFLIREEIEPEIEALLKRHNYEVEIIERRSVVIAHAPNMRDEPGLIAKIVRVTIESGVDIDQVGDMHDRVLLMVPSKEAERLTGILQNRLIEVPA